jgi:hypothetical protein
LALVEVGGSGGFGFVTKLRFRLPYRTACSGACLACMRCLLGGGAGGSSRRSIPSPLVAGCWLLAAPLHSPLHAFHALHHPAHPQRPLLLLLLLLLARRRSLFLLLPGPLPFTTCLSRTRAQHHILHAAAEHAQVSRGPFDWALGCHPPPKAFESLIATRQRVPRARQHSKPRPVSNVQLACIATLFSVPYINTTAKPSPSTFICVPSVRCLSRLPNPRAVHENNHGPRRSHSTCHTPIQNSPECRANSELQREPANDDAEVESTSVTV